MIRPGTGGSEGSGVIGIAPAIDGATAGDLGSANRTVVRRSAPPAGIASPTRRLSAGPPRAGSGPTVTKASSARVVARRGMASCATVTRTSRGEGGRARISSTSAAPETAPRISPRARKLNSLGVTLPASRGSCSFASGAPSSGQRSLRVIVESTRDDRPPRTAGVPPRDGPSRPRGATGPSPAARRAFFRSDARGLHHAVATGRVHARSRPGSGRRCSPRASHGQERPPVHVPIVRW